MFKSIALGASALALAALPVAANAATAATPVRAQSTVGNTNELAGGASIAPLVILAGVIAGVAYLIVDHEDDNNDRPASR